MNVLDLLDKRVYGATLTRWLLALVTLAAVYVVLSVGRRIMAKRLGVRAARTEARWDDLAADLFARTRWYFLLVVALEVAAAVVSLQRAAAAPLRLTFVVAALLQIGVWGNGIITFITEQYSRQKLAGEIATRATIHAVGYLARAALWAVLAIMALDSFGVRITTLIAGLGIGGVAVALAAQNILGDLFAALAIVLDRPFVIGDFIVFDDLKGEITHIGLKTTRVRSLGGEEIVVANSDLLKSRIRNYGRMQQRRVVFALDVTYDTPPDKVAKIPGLVRAVIESQKKTRFDRCHFLSFADSSLRFETVYFVLDPDYNRYADIQHAINLDILRQFSAEKIEFAFPSRTVFTRGDAPKPGLTQT